MLTFAKQKKDAWTQKIKSRNWNHSFNLIPIHKPPRHIRHEKKWPRKLKQELTRPQLLRDSQFRLPPMHAAKPRCVSPSAQQLPKPSLLHPGQLQHSSPAASLLPPPKELLAPRARSTHIPSKGCPGSTLSTHHCSRVFIPGVAFFFKTSW